MNLEQHLSSNVGLTCPRDSKLREQITTHAIPGGWAVWWRCSACHRWHMIEIPGEPEKPSSRVSWENYCQMD